MKQTNQDNISPCDESHAWLKIEIPKPADSHNFESFLK